MPNPLDPPIVGTPDELFHFLVPRDRILTPGCWFCDWWSNESGPGHDKDCPNRPFDQGD